VTAPAEAATPTPANPTSRIVLATLIGTTIEFYDFYAYATAAVLVFPALFFPSGDPTISLLLSFSVFGAAMVARPLGAIFFGHLGDRIGRKATLVASLLTMGVATFLIGTLPTYAMVGVWATLMLLVLRLAQGFALGGEWSGAALVATENAPEGKRAWFGTFPQLGAPLGFIIANSLFLVIAALLPNAEGTGLSAAFLEWGWRIPFLFSAVMVIIGLWVRLRLVEATPFAKAAEEGRLVRVPLATVFRTHWRQLILGTLYMLATYVIFYLMSSWSLSYGTQPSDKQVLIDRAAAAGQPFNEASYWLGLGYGYNDFVLLTIGGVVFFGVFVLVSGPLADRFGRRRFLIVIQAAMIAFGLLFVPLLGGGLPGLLLYLVIGFSLMGLTFGPQAALLPELFPTNLRYTGSGISYNVSSILGAAVAPLIAVALVQATHGSPVLVGLYLAAMAAISLVALLVGRETKGTDYHA